jgi:hypothetical protein
MVWPVCLQSTPDTCSAAAAATVLGAYGIETNEQEMAKLCLTKRGTTWLGLYHGLSIKLGGRACQVQFFRTGADELAKLAADGPLLLCCQLDPKIAHLAPEYVREDGWIPGVAHTVVYFGRVNAVHIIGDPSQGYEKWSNRDLSSLWSGHGLRVHRIDALQP